jgi:hypothetical protein
MPKPGKLPLNRLNRVKGPVYRHASLFPEGQQIIPISPYLMNISNSRSRPWVVCRSPSRSYKCFWIEACEAGLGSSPYTVNSRSATAHTLTHAPIEATDLVIRILKVVILHEAVSWEKDDVPRQSVERSVPELARISKRPDIVEKASPAIFNNHRDNIELDTPPPARREHTSWISSIFRRQFIPNRSHPSFSPSRASRCAHESRTPPSIFLD